MLILLVISLTVTVLLCILLLLRIRENRSLAGQIRELSMIDSNSLVHTSYSAADIVRLAKEINVLFEKLRVQEVTMRRKGERMDMMLANISHDLRTPLTSALGYIDMINTEALSSDKPYDDTVLKELEIIEKRLHRLSELIDAFFEFSKIITSDRLPEKKELVLVSVLEESIAHYYDDYVGRKRSIIFENEAGRQKLYSNRNMLLRIFDNLIGNALKHGTGDLTVKTEYSGQAENSSFSVTFSNSFEGDEMDVEHIFDEFYTRDISRTGGNTGLGLAIAKEFTELLGGSIRAEAENGRLKLIINFPAGKGQP